MSKEKILNDYIDYKATGIKTKRKLVDLKFIINSFLNSSKKSLGDFTEKDLVDYLNKIAPKYSENSFNGIRSYIKSFIKWFFVDYSQRFRNLEKLCRQKKAPQTYQAEEMLSKEDIQKLVQNEESSYWKAYWLTLFYSGSRPGEICSLKWKQVDLNNEGAFIKIYSDKNKNYFDKFVPEDVAVYLRKLQTNNSEFVFPSSANKEGHISVKGVYQRLSKLSKNVFGKKINPYILRHSIATILYNDDKIPNKEDVANQMGHNKSMEKTYSHLSKEKMRERARKIWINPKEDLTPKEKSKIKELEIRILKLENIRKKELIAYNIMKKKT